MWDAKVGDQVVCIKAFGKSNRDQFEIVPKVNQILTIRDIVGPKEASTDANAAACYFRFTEILNDKFEYNQGLNEVAFDCHAFRPILKTDISAFTAILEKPSKKIKAPEGPVRKVKADA